MRSHRDWSGNYCASGRHLRRAKTVHGVLICLLASFLAAIVVTEVRAPQSDASTTLSYADSVLQAPAPAVAYWRLGDAPGTSTIHNEVSGSPDASGLVGARGQSGAISTDTANTSFYYAGSGSGFGGDALNFQDVGVEAWVKIPSTGASGNLMWKANNAYFLRIDSSDKLVGGGWYCNPLVTCNGTADFYFTVTSDAPISRDRWHHTAMIANGSTIEIYLDGVLVKSGTYPYPLQRQHSTLVHGGTLGGGGDGGHITGYLDEVAVYSSPNNLTAAEIAAHVRAAGAVGGLVQPGERRGGGDLNDPCAPAFVPTVGRYPIGLPDGNFFHTFADIAVPGRGVPLAFARTYDALAAVGPTPPNGWPLGVGWTHSYNLFLDLSDPNKVVVNNENGSQTTFAGTGPYTAAPRVVAVLTSSGSGTGKTYSFVRQGSTTYTFDYLGQLTAEQDLNGNTTAITRPNSTTTVVTDSTGRTLTLTASGSPARLSSVEDSGSPQRRVDFAYNDGQGNLTDVTDVGAAPGGVRGITHFTYDSSHRLTQWLDPVQQALPAQQQTPLVNTYDTSNRVTSQQDFAGRTTTYNYDYASVPADIRVTDPKGNKTLYSFSNGLLGSKTKAFESSQAAIWTYSYDPNCLGIAAVIDPNNHTTRMTYDISGNMLTRTDPLGRLTAYTFDSLTNKITSVKDPIGITTTFTYDNPNRGNLVSASTPWAEKSPQTRTTTYAHADGAHHEDVTTLTDPVGKNWLYEYEASGDLKKATDPLGNLTKYCYDSIGRYIKAIQPKGTAAGVNCATSNPTFTYLYEYNNAGDVTKVTDPLGHVTTREYDRNRNLALVKDANNNQTTYDYNKDDELVTVHRPSSPATTLTYAYWDDGTLKEQADGAGNATTYAYDALAHLSSSTDPNGRPTTYSYDPVGNLLTKQDHLGSCATPKVSCTTYTYDAADQMNTIDYSDSTPDVTNIGYDDDGQRTAMTVASGGASSSWVWDSLHNLTSWTNDGRTVSYDYDKKGQVTSITQGSTNTATRFYDDAGRLDLVKDWLTPQHTTDFDYDVNSNVILETYPNGLKAEPSFDAADRLMSINHKRISTGATFASFTYGRDNGDRITSVTPTGVTQGNETYQYSPLDQLKQVNSSLYNYDTADNLTQLATSTTMTYDPANQVRRVATSGSNPSTNYGFDTRGNRIVSIPTRGTGRRLNYDLANRLTASTPTYPHQLAGGYFHSLAVGALGTVFGWGWNFDGELGNNTQTDSTSPVQVVTDTIGTPLASVSVVSAGLAHSLALKFDGSVWSWGDNASGQLGLGHQVDKKVAKQVTGVSGINAIAGGTSHSLAAGGVSGNVWSWGANANGQLGDGTTNLSSSPVQVNTTNVHDIVEVAAGQLHSLALRSDGTVWAWGGNANGQLGDDSTTQRTTPVQVKNPDGSCCLSDIIAIAAGSAHSLALRADGTVFSWGINTVGQLGDGTTGQHEAPVQVKDGSGNCCLDGVVAISAGWVHSMALRSSGSVRTWGEGGNGQLGNGSTSDSWVPVQTTSSGLSAVGALAAGGYHSLVLNGDGRVMAYGSNNNGGLGDGTTTQRNAPVQSQFNYNQQTATNAPATYVYNGDGLRSSKTVASTTTNFTWDVSQGLPLLLKDGNNKLIYGMRGLPVEQIDGSGNAAYFHQDNLGSTRLLSDGAGTVPLSSNTYSYDAYGRTTNAPTSGAVTSVQYAGQYTDSESGLQYLRTRYYEPGIGQFISRDPAYRLTQSAYAYVAGNPISFDDPLGLVKTTFTYADDDIERISKRADKWMRDPNVPPGGQLTHRSKDWVVSFGFPLGLQWLGTARLNEDSTYFLRQVGYDFEELPWCVSGPRRVLHSWEREVFVTYHYHSKVLFCGGDLGVGNYLPEDACQQPSRESMSLYAVDWNVTFAIQRS